MTDTLPDLPAVPPVTDMACLAALVQRLGPGEPWEACLGLAFAAANRADAAAAYRAAFGVAHPRFGAGSLSEACAGLLRELSGRPCGALPIPADPLAGAAAALAVARAAPDPVHGAVACFDHRAAPRWARRMRATAWLGRFVFCRDTGGPCPPGCSWPPAVAAPRHVGQSAPIQR